MRVNQDVFSKTIAGEEMLVHMASGQYYGMDPVATRIWQGIKSQTPIAEIVAGLTEEFAVDATQAEADVLALIAELKTHGLIA